MLAVEIIINDVCFVMFSANTFNTTCYDLSIVTDAHHSNLNLVIKEVVDSVRSQVYCADNTRYTYVYTDNKLYLTYEGGVVEGCQLQQLPDNLKLSNTKDVVEQMLRDSLASVLSTQLSVYYSDIQVQVTESKRVPLMVNCGSHKQSLQSYIVDSSDLLQVLQGKILHNGGCNGEQFVHADSLSVCTTHQEIIEHLLTVM